MTSTNATKENDMADQKTFNLKADAKFIDGERVRCEFKDVPGSVLAEIIALIQTRRNEAKSTQ